MRCTVILVEWDDASCALFSGDGGIQEWAGVGRWSGSTSRLIIQDLRSALLSCFLQLKSCPEIILLKMAIIALKAKVKVRVAQSCLTPCNPMDYTAHGIFQVRILGWVAFPFFRESSHSRNQTRISCIAGRFFTNWAHPLISPRLRENKIAGRKALNIKIGVCLSLYIF